MTTQQVFAGRTPREPILSRALAPGGCSVCMVCPLHFFWGPRRVSPLPGVSVDTRPGGKFFPPPVPLPLSNHSSLRPAPTFLFAHTCCCATTGCTGAVFRAQHSSVPQYSSSGSLNNIYRRSGQNCHLRLQRSPAPWSAKFHVK
jgi:hypothetical protein